MSQSTETDSYLRKHELWIEVSYTGSVSLTAKNEAEVLFDGGKSTGTGKGSYSLMFPQTIPLPALGIEDSPQYLPI